MTVFLSLYLNKASPVFAWVQNDRASQAQQYVTSACKIFASFCQTPPYKGKKACTPHFPLALVPNFSHSYALLSSSKRHVMASVCPKKHLKSLVLHNFSHMLAVFGCAIRDVVSCAPTTKNKPWWVSRVSSVPHWLPPFSFASVRTVDVSPASPHTASASPVVKFSSTFCNFVLSLMIWSSLHTSSAARCTWQPSSSKSISRTLVSTTSQACLLPPPLV